MGLGALATHPKPYTSTIARPPMRSSLINPAKPRSLLDFCSG